MKRVFVLTLALVLVFAAGAFAQSIVETEYGTKVNQQQTLDVGIKILPYAEILVNEGDNKLFAAPILSRVGLYTSNEWQVINDAKVHFGLPSDHEAILEDHNGGAIFTIESNYEFNIDVEVSGFDDLVSQWVFFVYNHDGRPWPPVKDDAQLSKLTPAITKLTFQHPFGEHEYKIGGALWIDKISEQRADTYFGTITLTVAGAVGAE